MKQHMKRRRGIVILVVLSLLVLFVLLAVTFAIVAGQYRMAAEMNARGEELRDNPRRLLDRAMYELLRDSKNPNSAIRGHSLLRDKYGADGFAAHVGAAVAQASGQMLELSISTNPIYLPIRSTDGTILYGPGTPPIDLMPKTDGFFAGCELTFTSGPARGNTTRIVDYEYQTSQPYFVLRVVNFSKHHVGAISANSLVGHRFVVNGRPFNGNGAGFDSTTGQLSKQDGSFQSFLSPTPNFRPWVALLPNYTNVNIYANYLSDGQNAVYGGLDESYDAPDYQNLFMGMVLPNATRPWQVIPSFHRPALINFWERYPYPAPPQTAAGPNNTFQFSGNIWHGSNGPHVANALKRRVVLRPLPADHPNFTGTNLGFTLEASTRDFFDNNRPYDLNFPPDGIPDNDANLDQILDSWDVDNDGDGVTDSVWVDVGFPVMTARDGRRYKALFAFLCTDLDGRLNVNAHGTVTASTVLPRGLGYGPPEVRLIDFFGSEYSQLLQSRYASNNPGMPLLDTMSAVRFFEFPPNFFAASPAAPRGAFGSPPDLHGELTVASNTDGQPNFANATTTHSVADSPYELNLGVLPSGGDNAFTAADLEPILRSGDLDIQTRQLRLGSYSVFQSRRARHNVTTHSFDLPTPNIVAVSDTLANALTTLGINRPHSIVDLLRARILTDPSTVVSNPSSPSPTEEKAIAAIIRERLLSYDLVMGIRMDVNRPLGNGLDDNNNRIVDEPHEIVAGGGMEVIWNSIANPSYANTRLEHTNRLDVTGNGFDSFDRLLARQLLARHLYVLALAISERPTSLAAREAQAKEIAQWAVNVVDFRDADSIMTPFEYDIEPFDFDLTSTPPKLGWDVDGVVDGYMDIPVQNLATGIDDQAPHRRLVWGVERPELLMTETLAFHARRTQDTAADAATGKDTSRTDPNDPNSPRGDDDYDQRLLPVAGTFIELYNPWTGTDTQYSPPGEFYRDQLGQLIGNPGTLPNPKYGVKLNVATPNAEGSQPVWRLLVANSVDGDVVSERSPDLDTNPGAANRPTIERSVYFRDPTTLPPTGDEGNVRYWTTMDVAPIQPGRYAVVGSRGQLDQNNERVTPVGDIDPNINPNVSGLENTRRIAVTPNADPDVNQVKVYDFGPGGNLQALTPPQPAVGIAINQSSMNNPARFPLNFAVSEPLDGYPKYDMQNPGPNGEVYTAGVGYEPPLGTPLDKRDPSSAFPGRYRQAVAETNGTTASFARVYLQRLADPLKRWHATGNPYRTIDTMTINLTSFNGHERHSSTADPDITQRHPVHFRCLQRGDDDQRYQNNNRHFRLWAFEPPGIGAQTPPHNGDYHFFPYALSQNNRQTFGYVNTNYQSFNTVLAPWLNWNNRPYVSQFELMLVPNRNNFDLLKDFDMLGTQSLSPYDQPTPQFTHLPNFFQFAVGTDIRQANHFYRLLEFLHVPSRFDGTQTFLSPAVFASGPGTNWFHPPFNRISSYRDPGKINLNTINDPNVYGPLMAGFPAPTFNEVINSRRGFTSGNNLILPLPQPVAPLPGAGAGSPQLHIPTFFANPFRSPGNGARVPDLESVSALNTSLIRHDVEATILRSTNVAPSSTTAPPAPTNAPLFQVNRTTVDPTTDERRNPYYRYRNLTRLGNMATNRSNVFAVWITVGFFEVERNPGGIDEAHPDGFRLGQELGIDTGSVQRHRAFYILDRSIPVAFEPGENHNVDEAVLLRRFIE